MAGEFRTVSKYARLRTQRKEGIGQVEVRSLDANVTRSGLACHTGALSFIVIVYAHEAMVILCRVSRLDVGYLIRMNIVVVPIGVLQVE